MKKIAAERNYNNLRKMAMGMTVDIPQTLKLLKELKDITGTVIPHYAEIEEFLTKYPSMLEDRIDPTMAQHAASAAVSNIIRIYAETVQKKFLEEDEFLGVKWSRSLTALVFNPRDTGISDIEKDMGEPVDPMIKKALGVAVNLAHHIRGHSYKVIRR